MAAPSVTCYPIPGKPKALQLCKAFAAGVRAAGGEARIDATAPKQLGPGAAVFYGVRPVVEHLWQQAKAEGRDWFYIDNAYFDADRGTRFRVTKNAVQVNRVVPATDAALRVPVTVKPWRTTGDHVVVCQQSDEFMRTVAGWPGGAAAWLDTVLRMLRQVTDRPLRVRAASPQKRQLGASLQDDLRGAWALVAHTSAAANEAVLAGVPVLLTGECAATPYALNWPQDAPRFAGIDRQPQDVVQRPAWIAGLRSMQWTLDEIAKGYAWQALNR